LAKAAINTGGHTTKSGGKCALYVGNALSKVIGEKETSKLRGNAWQWISKLSSIGSKWFTKSGYATTDKQLKSLPPGSIAIWNKQPAHPYGHIEISDGKGNLISDFKRVANLNLYRRNPAGIKPLIFTPKGVKVPKLDEGYNKNGAEETSSSSDGKSSNYSDEQSSESMDYSDFIKQLSKEYSDMYSGVSSSPASSINTPSSYSTSGVSGISSSSESSGLQSSTIASTESSSEPAGDSKSSATVTPIDSLKSIDLPSMITQLETLAAPFISTLPSKQQQIIKNSVNAANTTLSALQSRNSSGMPKTPPKSTDVIPVNNNASSIITDILDADLALLNSILFQ